MSDLSLVHINKIYKTSKEWLLADTDFKYEIPMNYLVSYSENQDLESVNVGIIGYLRQLTLWHESMFIVNSFEEKDDAFTHLSKSFDYSFLRLQIETANIARLTYDNKYKIPSNSLIGLLSRENSLVLCKGLALGCFQVSEQIGQILLNCLNKNWF